MRYLLTVLAAVMIWLQMLPPPVMAQQAVSEQRTRTQIALDIFSFVHDDVDPVRIAEELRHGVRAFRMRCNRVSDYQLFAVSDGRIDIKVKCAGVPLFGMTVGSNGFMSVFGGNGMVAPFDRQDAMIFGFNPDGSRIFNSAQLLAPDGQGEIAGQLTTEEGLVTMVLLIGLFILVVIGLAGMVLLRRYRERSSSSGDVFSNLTSDLKNRMWQDSAEINEFVRRHPCGLYIAVGPRGKRRLFSNRFGAKRYAAKGSKFFEVFRVDMEHPSLQG